jgi:hypothetical protein
MWELETHRRHDEERQAERLMKQQGQGQGAQPAAPGATGGESESLPQESVSRRASLPPRHPTAKPAAASSGQARRALGELPVQSHADV